MVEEVQKRLDAIGEIGDAFRSLVESLEKRGGFVPEKLQTDIEGLEREYRTLADEAGRKLRIAVAGKFSCGKSQFINSLVGEEIASVDSARTTCCKTVFTGDPSINAIRITDSSGREYSREEYVQLSAKESASRKVFTVRLPDADWQDFEVVDTPGYDSIDEEDRQISEEAVADADVVFFLFDIGTGTIPKDSLDYLKKFVDSRQLFYLIANKADLKSEGARQTIIDSIASECQRNGLKYECVLPYSSLTPTSREILSKNETARANLLKLAKRLKDDAIGVVDKLVERANSIRGSKIDVGLSVADRHLSEFRDRVVEYFGLAFEKIVDEQAEGAAANGEELKETVFSLLLDSAIDYTERRASNFVRWHRLSGTGFFFNDWSVYLGKPGADYDLTDDDKTDLVRSLRAKCEECGILSDGVIEKLLELRREGALQTIDKYRIKDEDAPTDDAMFFYSAAIDHTDFCKTCDYESERRGKEHSILAELARVFPQTFKELTWPKVAEVLEHEMFKPFYKRVVLACFELMRDFCRLIDSCANVLHLEKQGEDLIQGAMSQMNVMLSPESGTARFSAESWQTVLAGQEVAWISPASDGGDVTVRATKSGQFVKLVDDVSFVDRLSPLCMIMPDDDDKSEEDAKTGHEVQIYGGAGDEVVSSVEGVVDGLCVQDGASVKQGDRILTVNVLNMHWPVCASCDGVVSFGVKYGDSVKPGDVLAKICE